MANPNHFQPGNSVGKQFEPANLAAVKSGSRSITVMNAALPGEVEAIRAALADSVPGLHPVDDLVLEQLARTVCELRLLQKWVDDRGGSPIDSRGRPRAMWRQYNAAHTRFMRYAAMLGISPAGRMAVLRDAGSAQRDHLAAVASEELRARYMAKALPASTEDAEARPDE